MHFLTVLDFKLWLYVIDASADLHVKQIFEKGPVRPFLGHFQKKLDLEASPKKVRFFLFWWRPLQTASFGDQILAQL